MPTGSSTVAPVGHERLLAVGGADGVLVEVAPAAAQALEDRPDPLLERAVERERAPAVVGDHLGGQVVGGRPEAAAGDDQVEVAHEPQRLEHVRAAVGDDHDLRDLHPVLAQALGQPGAVAVGDDPRQHLRARDEDPGPHKQVGPTRLGQLAWALAGPHVVADRRRAVGHVDRPLARPQPRLAVAERDAEALAAVAPAVPAGVQDLVVDQRAPIGVDEAHADGSGGHDLQGDTRRCRGLLLLALRLCGVGVAVSTVFASRSPPESSSPQLPST